MKKVEIISWTEPNNYESNREYTEVRVDGVVLLSAINGRYGGEPEDNMRCRVYRWVEPLIAALATELGAEVVLTSREGDPWDEV